MTVLMLDVDGVLVGGMPPGFDRDDAYDAALEAVRGELSADDWQALATGQADLLETIRARSTFPDPEALLDYWYRSETHIDAAVLAAVRKLRAEGTQVYLATNQEHRRARYLMETLGFRDAVDGMLHSAALGHRKPAPEYFAAATAKLAVPAADIVFVDDNEGNVLAARSAGWRATHWLGDTGLEAAISAAR